MVKTTEPETSGSELVTRPQAARLLGYAGKTSHTMRRLELRGLLTPVRITQRAIRYRRADIERLIDTCSGRAV
jgi:hypothetical protein